MSTHILPEVEQTCEQVIIINKGKLVATDSVANLQNRARGAESLLVEVAGRSGGVDPGKVQSRLELVFLFPATLRSPQGPAATPEPIIGT